MLARWFNDAFTKIFLKNGKQVATTGLKIMPSVTKKCSCFDFKKTWWWQRNSAVYLFDDLFANTNKISASIAVFQLRFNNSSKATRVIWYLLTSGTEKNSLFKLQDSVKKEVTSTKRNELWAKISKQKYDWFFIFVILTCGFFYPEKIKICWASYC